MNILGMTGPALHDTSAAVFADGELVAAAEEERYGSDLQYLIMEDILITKDEGRRA